LSQQRNDVWLLSLLVMMALDSPHALLSIKSIGDVAGTRNEAD